MTASNSQSMNATTIIIESPPFSTISGKEGIDLSLVCAAFEQTVNLVFVGLGVFHLIKAQDTEAIEDKLHDKQLTGLKFYDIETMYYQHSSLKGFGLKDSDLIEDCEPVEAAKIKAFIGESSQAVIF